MQTRVRGDDIVKALPGEGLRSTHTRDHPWVTSRGRVVGTIWTGIRIGNKSANSLIFWPLNLSCLQWLYSDNTRTFLNSPQKVLKSITAFPEEYWKRVSRKYQQGRFEAKNLLWATSGRLQAVRNILRTHGATQRERRRCPHKIPGCAWKVFQKPRKK